MNNLKENENFEKEMLKILEIMEIKGFIVEDDHPYAYAMQYQMAFNDVSEWLAKNGYEGNLCREGYFDNCVGAVYGIFDKNKMSHDKIRKELKKEVKRQKKG